MSAGRGPAAAATRTTPPRLSPAVVGVCSVAVLSVIAAGTAGGWWLQPRSWFDSGLLRGRQQPPMWDPPTLPPPLSQPGALQRWIGLSLAAVMVLAALVGLIYLARALWRRRPRRAVVVEQKPEPTPAGALAAEPDLATLLRGAQVAEIILGETNGVPRDLVLRCWLALEEAAAASGAPRRPSDSPTEFTGAVLRATQADRDSVDTLLRLYHRARFSPHPVTDDDVRAAHQAVVRLARRWRGFDTAIRRTARAEP